MNVMRHWRSPVYSMRGSKFVRTVCLFFIPIEVSGSAEFICLAVVDAEKSENAIAYFHQLSREHGQAFYKDAPLKTIISHQTRASKLLALNSLQSPWHTKKPESTTLPNPE